MGGFFTLTTSPTLTVWLGLTFCPPIVTRLFLQASAAMERVLKIRAAHSHLSIRAVSAIFFISFFYFFDFFPSLLNWFIVMSSPASTKLRIISTASSMEGWSVRISSSVYLPSTQSTCCPR